MNILKFGVAGIVGLMAITLFASSPATPAHAEPLGVVALNNGNCVALGSAFAGLAAQDAFVNCDNLDSQSSFQLYVHCVRGFDLNNDGKKECLNAGIITDPSDASFPLSAPVNIQADPSDFTALDIDANQIHLGIKYRIIAFVKDDFPVRFTADKGEFLTQDGISTGRNMECNNGVPGPTNGDPDCDADGATEGDGVVVASFQLTPDDGDSGVVHINVIQENVSFPVELNIVGPAETITLTPLFGRDTIQTGATRATPGNCGPTGFCQNADYTDCNFAATVDGVLGANNTAEKGVIVAKVLDNDGNEVIGSLIDWNHGFELLKDEDGNPLPPDPLDPNTVNLGPTAQGGVALPQTPTVDLGAALGFGFPQFVCGGDTPGDLVLKTSLNGVYDTLTPQGSRANAEVTIHVVGPAVDVSLKADPPELDCNGTNTTTITATFATATGDPTADGLDANFSVVALGTVNPLTSNTAKGVASTVLTPLSGAGNLTSDGGPAGVIVSVHANGQIHTIFGAPRVGPHSTWDPVDGSILVRCTGAPAAGTGTLPPEGAAPGGENAGAGAGPTGRIAGPDTGSAGISGSDSLTARPLLALVAAAMMLGGATLAVRRTR